MEQRDWEKRFEESFKCIQSDCDGNGVIPLQVAEEEWETQQCQFHAEYLFPLKSFIAQEIATARAEVLNELRQRAKERGEWSRGYEADIDALLTPIFSEKKCCEKCRVYGMPGTIHCGNTDCPCHRESEKNSPRQ